MKLNDKKYLILQFKVKVFSNNGTEYQSFYESIMEKYYSDFQKIKPLGRLGDGGNDGYRKDVGVYYQVYAPETPKIKESTAAVKLRKDFEKLKKEWDGISKIREYVFVFNDKYGGSAQPIEDAMAVLKANNPNIDFSLLLSRDLEDLFFKLSDESIIRLGFDIDSRKAISQLHAFLDTIEVELDRGCTTNASIQLDSCKDIVEDIDAVEITVRYQVLKGRVLNKLEKTNEAKDHFKTLIKKFPMESSPLLYLAEIYIHENEYDKNDELIARARKIDAKNTLIDIHELVRNIHLDVTIDLQEFNPESFSNNYREKSVMYRLYAHLFETEGKPDDADTCIERAMEINPDSLVSHLAYLTLLETRLIKNQRAPRAVGDAQLFLEEIEKVRDDFHRYGDIGPRNNAIINLMQIRGLLISESNINLESLATDTFQHALLCSFDKQVDYILVSLLTYFVYTDKILIDLFSYLDHLPISEGLSKCLVLRFGSSELIHGELKDFLQKNDNFSHSQLIKHIEAKEYDSVLKVIADDLEFSSQLSTNKNIESGLRKRLIDSIPDDSILNKDKLLLTLYYDDENYKEAFDLLNRIDLENISYHECGPILKILRKNEAWEKELEILQKLLNYEDDPNEILYLKIQLLNVYVNLTDYHHAAEIGRFLLEQDNIEKSLKGQNVESLLHTTIQSFLERGKIYQEFNAQALELHTKYCPPTPSWEYRLSSAVPVYLSNDMHDQAYNTVVAAIKAKKVLTPEQYASLYFLISIEIGNKYAINLESQGIVEVDTFVKLAGKDRWYYIGHGNELDAIRILPGKAEYAVMLNAKTKEKLVFEAEYSSSNREETVELIYSIEQYILWRVLNCFQNLSNENALEGVQLIDMSGESKDEFNPRYLLKFLSDLDAKKAPLFDLYCKGRVPLVMLAAIEGGLEQAVAKISLEGRGFINCNDGSMATINTQREIAKEIVVSDVSFIMDSTSALFLVESGLYEVVARTLSNIRFPQSVLTFLTDMAEKFKSSTGQVGKMGYLKGKITLSSLDEVQSSGLRNRFLDAIKVFDMHPENILNISSASKGKGDSEKLLPANMTDAYALAIREGIPLLSEDYYYKSLNEQETGRPGPRQLSSIALVRALFENNEISFNEYLDYYGYLSAYRFRLLYISITDIEKAAENNADSTSQSYLNFSKLNIQLTLSEDYGVPTGVSISLISKIVLRWIFDDRIPKEETQVIFTQILDTFPTKMSPLELGNLLLETSAQLFKMIKSDMPEAAHSGEKMAMLQKYLHALEGTPAE